MESREIKMEISKDAENRYRFKNREAARSERLLAGELCPLLPAGGTRARSGKAWGHWLGEQGVSPAIGAGCACRGRR
jgi:hypothetical protein